MRKRLHFIICGTMLLALVVASKQEAVGARDRLPAQSTGQIQSTAAQRSVEAQAQIDPEKTGPIRHYIMIQMLNGADVLALDRWYMTYHGRETLRRTQRRQTKYASFRTYAMSPEEAKTMNFWQGRMTEIGFASLADFDKGFVNIEEERKKITLPELELRGGFRNETVTIPLKPNEVFVGRPTPEKATPYFRWIFFYEYPEGVSVEAGEKWFREVFAKALSSRPEVKRFVTYRSIRGRQVWNRVAEVWFENPSAWRKAVYERRNEFTRPSWGGEFPFMKFQSTFIGENPDVDFLNETFAIP